MTDFTRARCAKNKEIRFDEIKAVAEQLFQSHTYHDISLSCIAKSLCWSRANLYKYVCTKEEIFLAILTDKMKACFSSLIAAFPIGSNYSDEVFADVMAGILKCNMDFLRYYAILPMIIETNVSLDRLVDFKKNYLKSMTELTTHFCAYSGLTAEQFTEFSFSVFYHALGLCSGCMTNPLAKEACEIAGISHSEIDFQKSMKSFIIMCLKYSHIM